MNSYSRILNCINHHLVTCYCRNPGNLLWVSPTYYNLKGYFPFSSSIMIHINFSLKVSRAASASSAPPHLVSGVFTVAISGDLGTPWRSESWCLANLANLANLSCVSSCSAILRNIEHQEYKLYKHGQMFELWIQIFVGHRPSSSQRSSSTLMQHSTVSSVCPGPGHAVTSAMTTNLWWC